MYTEEMQRFRNAIDNVVDDVDKMYLRELQVGLCTPYLQFLSCHVFKWNSDDITKSGYNEWTEENLQFLINFPCHFKCLLVNYWFVVSFTIWFTFTLANSKTSHILHIYIDIYNSWYLKCLAGVRRSPVIKMREIIHSERGTWQVVLRPSMSNMCTCIT